MEKGLGKPVVTQAAQTPSIQWGNYRLASLEYHSPWIRSLKDTATFEKFYYNYTEIRVLLSNLTPTFPKYTDGKH